MKKNAKTGNFSLLAVLGCILVMSMAAAAEALAAPVFPYAVGYTATYSVTYPDGSSGTATFQVTGTENISGTQWMIAETSNWDVSGDHGSVDIRCTTDIMYSLYTNATVVPTFEELSAGSSWGYVNQHGYQETATVLSVGPLTVAAGTFTNVYRVNYYATGSGGISHNEDMYWAPGVGLIKDVDNCPNSPWSCGSTKTMELTSFAQAQNVEKWTGPVSFSLKLTTIKKSASGVRGFATSTDTFNGTMNLYWDPIEASATPGGPDDCFLELLGSAGSDDTKICFNEMAGTSTLCVGDCTKKSNKSSGVFVGTGNFTKGEVTGIIYINGKGSMVSKGDDKNLASISLGGAVGGGTFPPPLEDATIFSGTIPTTALSK